ncbi:TonB-dependent receptor, partial [candidate division KSB1 bacterium]|nr:TonB-dependent receptor [candidate division KSB1 bacterium]
RQKSNAVSDAISSEAISRSGSGDAAQAMKQVTGASVVGGKYVYIRGLGERYSSTHLNGAELPSADPDKKAFQMDLFPANLLQNIVTLKTFTPDKPGNFSGGVVDIGTKTFPESFTLAFSSSATYNSHSTFNDNFLGYSRGSDFWMASDDGIHSLPGALQNKNLEIPHSTLARLRANSGDFELANQLDYLSKSFNNIMAPVQETGPVNQSYNFSIGNQINFLGRPLGYLAGLTYSNGASFYEDGFTGRYTLGDENADGLNPQLLLNDSEGKLETSYGGLFNLGYKFTPNNKIIFNSVVSKSASSSARYQLGSWPKEYTLADTTNFFENRVLKYTERELLSYQLRGEHLFPALINSTVEWSASLATNEQDEPDTRYFADLMRVKQGDTTYTARHSGFRDPSRYFRNMEEENQNYSLDLNLPFKQWSGLNSKFKMGGAYKHTDRVFRERIFSISTALNYDGDPARFFSSANMGIVNIDTLANGRYSVTFGNTLREISKTKNNYDGELEVAAGYAMVELPITPLFKFTGGVRYETTDLKATSQDTTQTVGKVVKQDWLPSLNFVYTLNPDMNVRLAWTKTLARPTFREIAPFESFEFIQGNFFIGNPELERTLINNIDLRWEWFMRPGEIVALSTFYKHLENPIERVIIGGTNGQIQYQNVDKATVYGVEFEVRKQLDVVSPLLANFSSGANFSTVFSTINIAETELAVRKAVNPAAEDTRPLQGQSPYLLNLSLNYDEFKSNLKLGLYLNLFGKRLSNVSLGGTPDVYERARAELDFTGSKGLAGNVDFKFGIKNILDSKYKESYEFKGNEFVYQEYGFGRSYMLGLSYKI